MVIRLSILLCWLAAATLAGCGGGDDSPGATPTADATRPAEETATPPVTPAAEPVQGRFDAGGHKLWVKCTGSGSPTVVYVHPYVADDTDKGAAAAGRLPRLLAPRHRVCVYDRANVGRSDRVDGIQTGEDATRDLHRALRSAGVEGPYLLVGSGIGGLIAGMYSATYPDEVSGMVLLDGRLPGDLDVEERFLPAAQRVQAGDWRQTVERLDQVESYRQAQALEGDEPPVPVTFIGPKDLQLDPSLPTNRITAAIRDMQQTFLDRFTPGKLVLLDTPVPMEPFVADEIAEVVDEVAEDAAEAAQEAAEDAGDDSG
jgi:pimeloyl-ACP methyl ester carboxylesterase